MNAYDFEQAFKEEEKCKYCGREIKDCICSDRETVLENIRKSANGL